MKSLLIIATSAILTLAANGAQAQTTSAAASGSAATADITEIVITGTRRLDRTVADSASPVDVISNTDLIGQQIGRAHV